MNAMYRYNGETGLLEMALAVDVRKIRMEEYDLLDRQALEFATSSDDLSSKFLMAFVLLKRKERAIRRAGQ